jgi:hypothetical protein
MRQLRWLVLIAALVVIRLKADTTGAAAQSPGSPSPRHFQLVIVVDGLRPERDAGSHADALSPRAAAYGYRASLGLSDRHARQRFVDRHRRYRTHGLLGNTIYIPTVNATRGLDTESGETSEAVERAELRLLGADARRIHQQHGRKLLGVSSGRSGSRTT